MTGQEPDVGLVSPPSTLPSDPPGAGGVNDDVWFRELFETSYLPLLAYARRRTGDHTEADDVVSEVFAIAWRRRAERRRDLAPLPWLYGIAANVARNQWRANGRRLRLVDHLEAQPPSPSTDDPSVDDGLVVREALAALSFDDSEVLRLVAWEGLSHAEVGEVLGCSTNAVGIRVHRARQRLQAQLNAIEEGAP